METIPFHQHAHGADPLNTLIPAITFEDGLHIPALPYMTRVYQSAVGPTALYQGGVHEDMLLPKDIRYVVSLHANEYKVRFGTKLKCLAQFQYIRDMEDQDPEVLGIAADVAVGFLRQHDGGVLVHCMAGVNRSGVVTALVLMRHFGWSADHAISYLREVRSPGVLYNPTFEAYVKSVDESW
jgi:hypothetical protein